LKQGRVICRNAEEENLHLERKWVVYYVGV